MNKTLSIEQIRGKLNAERKMSRTQSETVGKLKHYDHEAKNIRWSVVQSVVFWDDGFRVQERLKKLF